MKAVTLTAEDIAKLKFKETMGERAPVVTAAELATLDDAEILEGYRDGRAGEPEPGDNRSKSYWHGWRNGRVDGGHAQPDGAGAALIADLRRTGKLAKLFAPSPLSGGR